MDADAAADAVSWASAARPAPAPPPTGAADASAGCGPAIYDKQLAWKLLGLRKLQLEADALRSREEEQCSFAPKTNRRSPQKAPVSLVASPRSDRSARSVDGASAASAASGESSLGSPQPSAGNTVHPTDAQEGSILLHFARQERARGFASAAQQKLASTLPTKDFSKTTTSAPFALSTGNWRPRESTVADGRERAKSASPSRATATASAPSPDDQQQQSASALSSTPPPPPPVHAASRSRPKAKAGGGPSNNQSRPGSTRSLAAEDAWETERATLVAVLDAQRRELALRARAQADAVRAAESFAAATQRFEERLAALETRTADELHEIRRLLTRQAAASDLILRSLGLALPPDSASSTGGDGGGKSV